MTRTAPSRPARHSRQQKFTLIALVVVAAATVFLLPRFVTEPWFGAAPEHEPVTPQVSPSTPSPSAAAELRKYRQDAQSVLARIIAVRDRLLERNVEQWAAAEFRQAVKNIQAADEQYSFGGYEAALDGYRQALDTLTGLEELGQRKLAESKREAASAIEQGNVNVAVTASRLASTIAPEDPEAVRLAGRVEALPEVAALLEQGDRARDRDRLDAARAAYEEALQLDPQHRRAAEALAATRRDITDRAFRRHMSRGFAALEAGDFVAARSAFGEAQAIHPGHPDVREALGHVDNVEARNRVSRQLARGAELEAEEQWQEALEIYRALLDDDPSLAAVRARLIPVEVRAELDRRLAEVMEDPLALSDPARNRRAQAVLADARGIRNPGERLRGQIAGLESMLEAAGTVVEVVFRSDSQTQVVVYQVANLGRFDRKSIKLRPGRYVAAGSRKGYRDVRVEFTVTPQPLEEPIVVRCEEPI